MRRIRFRREYTSCIFMLLLLFANANSRFFRMENSFGMGWDGVSYAATGSFVYFEYCITSTTIPNPIYNVFGAVNTEVKGKLFSVAHFVYAVQILL